MGLCLISVFIAFSFTKSVPFVKSRALVGRIRDEALPFFFFSHNCLELINWERLDADYEVVF